MRSRLRVLLVVVVLVVIVGGAAVAVLTTKPDLDDAQARVDEQWTPLRKPLQLRYRVLAGLTDQVTQAGGGDREAVQELGTVLARWDELAADGDAHADAGAEAKTANQLEALAQRLKATVLGSARLADAQGVKDGITLLDTTIAPQPLMRAYNRAVRDFQEMREQTLDRIVASVFGIEERSLLVPGG